VKLSSSSFQDQDKLYRSYILDDLDEGERLMLGRIKFPDMSCNWGKFSKPEDILFRENAKQTDGCYSFTVEASRYENMATPVHDPVFGDKEICQNYAHAEVRSLRKGESIHSEPPRGKRKLKPDAKKMAYRQNIRKLMQIELEAI
jgi:hypothetical protein